MRILAILAALFICTASVSAADPVGRYDVSDTNAGKGSQYYGTVRVNRTGETYRVVWIVGGTRYVATGIGERDFLAVSCRSGNVTRLVLYSADGGNWAGVWTYAGGRQVGGKIWKHQ